MSIYRYHHNFQQPRRPANHTLVPRQFARPDSDVAAGAWTATTLYTKVDEGAPDDSDFIESPSAPSLSVCELGLSDIADPSRSDQHVVRLRARKSVSTGHQIDLRLRLLQGATEIASWTDLTNVPDAVWQNYHRTLSTAQADAITDYTDLRVELRANQNNQTPPAPTFVAAGTAAQSATSGASISPGLPSGWAAGDIHLLVAHVSNNIDFNDPSGWTRIAALSGTNTSAQRVATWWRRAVGGDAAPSISMASSTTGVRIARIYGFRGCLASGDPWDSGAGAGPTLKANAASATISTTSITTVATNCTVVFIGAYEDDPTTASLPSGYTAIGVSGTALGADAMLCGHYKTLTGTSTEAPTTTVSGGTFANSVNVGLMIALKPVAYDDAKAQVSWVEFEAPEIAIASQTITLTGGGSGESLGVATVSVGPVTINPSGIGSAEESSSIVLVSAATLTAAAIERQEAFGNLVVSPVAGIGPAGVASDEGISSAATIPGDVIIAPSAAISDEQIGAPVTANIATVAASGIEPADELGNPFTVASYGFTVAGISGGEASGNPAMIALYALDLAGIDSTEGFGPIQAAPGAVNALLAGIGAEEAPGAVSITPGAVVVTPAAVLSDEAVGAALASANAASLLLTGIGSAEQSGPIIVAPGAVALVPGSITPGEAVGKPMTVPGAVAVTATGIESVEAAGAPVLLGSIALTPVSIASGEAPGAMTLTPGALTILPASLLSGEAMGAPLTSANDLALALAGVASAEATGAVTVTPGAANMLMSGVESAETIGALSLLGSVAINPAAIAGAEASGAPLVTPGAVSVLVYSTVSAEALGAVTNALTLDLVGIDSSEVAGAAQVAEVYLLLPTGIGASEAVGLPVVSVGAANIMPSGIASDGVMGYLLISGGKIGSHLVVDDQVFIAIRLRDALVTTLKISDTILTTLKISDRLQEGQG